jgi:hypothetical protein
LVGGAERPSHGSDRPQSTPCSVARQQAASPGFSTQSNKRCDPVRLRKRFCNCVAAATYASVPSWAVLVRAARKASAPAGSGSGCSGPCLKWVNRVVLTLNQPLPVYPDQRTSPVQPVWFASCREVMSANIEPPRKRWQKGEVGHVGILAKRVRTRSI